MSSSNCCFFIYIHFTQEVGKMVWYSHLFNNFPQFAVIHPVKGFHVADEAVDVCWNSLAFSMIQQMLAIWSVVPLCFLNANWTPKSSWFIYYWSLACRILRITLLACKMKATLWLFEHSLGLKWNLTFSSPVATPGFSKFSGILSAALLQPHFLGLEIAQLEFHYLP